MILVLECILNKVHRNEDMLCRENTKLVFDHIEFVII